MKRSHPAEAKRTAGGWKEFLRRSLVAEGPNATESGSQPLAISHILRKAWQLFLGLSFPDRCKLSGAYLLLSLVGFLKERTYLGGDWQEFWFWLVHLGVSLWTLSFFLPPPRPRETWWQKLPGVILFVLGFDLFCQIVWLLVFYGAALQGILLAWLLPMTPVAMVAGKWISDLLVLVVPGVLFLGLAVAFLWFLLGFSFVIPLMLARGTGIWPAVTSSLQASKGRRMRLMVPFVLVALILGLPYLLTSLGRVFVVTLPFAQTALIPPSPLGVWICFWLQTIVLVLGTALAIWIWPLGGALWAALYHERWKPRKAARG